MNDLPVTINRDELAAGLRITRKKLSYLLARKTIPKPDRLGPTPDLSAWLTSTLIEKGVLLPEEIKNLASTSPHSLEASDDAEPETSPDCKQP